MAEVVTQRRHRIARGSGRWMGLALLLSLPLLAAAPALAVDTTCPGTSTQDAAGYYCATYADPAVSPGVTQITSWSPRGATGDQGFAFRGFDAGKTFTWYGQTYNGAFIGTNGFVSFLAGSANEVTYTLPNTAAPLAGVFAFGDDLMPGLAATGIYYDVAGDCAGGTNNCFVVEWRNYAVYVDGVETGDVDVRLGLVYSTGEALVEATSAGVPATSPFAVGTNNATGLVGLQVRSPLTAPTSAAVGASITKFKFALDPAFTTEPPAAPTRASASANGSTVTLQFALPDGVEDYLIVRSENVTSDVAPTDGATYTVGGTLGTGTIVAFNTDPLLPPIQFVDNDVTPATNDAVYYYDVYARGSNLKYSLRTRVAAYPRIAANVAWSYSGTAALLAAPGVNVGSQVGATTESVLVVGNDRMFQQVAADDAFPGWVPALLGGAVQHRPVAGDLGDTVAADHKAYIAAQDGTLSYYSSLTPDGATKGPVAAVTRTANTDLGATNCIFEGGPVVAVAEFSAAAGLTADRLVVASRCTDETKNRVMLYNPALNAVPLATYATGVTQGINVDTPVILYRAAGDLVYVPLQGDNNGVGVAVLTVGDTSLDEFAKVTGVGDVNTTPVLVRNQLGTLMLVGSTAGELNLFRADVANAGSLTFLDKLSPGDVGGDFHSDGAITGISALAKETDGTNWIVWSDASDVHTIKIKADGTFDETTLGRYTIASPSAPMLVRGLNAPGLTGLRVAFVGGGDGKLYRLSVGNPLISLIGTDTLFPSAVDIGDPTLDYNNGTDVGILVGSSAGVVFRVRINQ